MDYNLNIYYTTHAPLNQLSKRHCFNIFLILEGTLIILKNNTFHHFKVGDIFHIHDYECVKHISFNGTLICLSINNFYYYQCSSHQNDKNNTYIPEKYDLHIQFSDMIKAIQHKSNHRFNQSINRLIKSIYVLDDGASQYTEIQNNYKHRLIKDVVHYVNTHLTTKVSCQQIANQFFVNNSFLSREFSALMGCKLSNYITSSKIHASICDLLEGDQLNTIQQRYGFRTQDDYCYLFKRFIGYQPSEIHKYRNPWRDIQHITFDFNHRYQTKA